jgi:hypothetical protein
MLGLERLDNDAGPAICPETQVVTQAEGFYRLARLGTVALSTTKAEHAVRESI